MGGQFSSGRCAFHFDSSPFFQQGKSGGIIEVFEPVLARNLVNLFDGFERGQFNPSLFGSFQGKVDILVH